MRAFLSYRALLVLYAALAIALSLILLLLSLDRGLGELSLWLTAYLGLALLSRYRPRASPLVGGAMAFLLGFVRTNHSGYNLDLGLGLIALSVGLYVLGRTRRGEDPPVDLAGLSLLSIAAWSLISLGFAVARIRAFAPAPGFGYHTYRFSALGFTSDEVMIRAAIGAAVAFTWFGLYEYARSEETSLKALNVIVFLILLVNAAALVGQRYLDPSLLQPAGLLPPGRLNGVTSFCYALGDAMLALFLLLPVWGSRRGLYGALTAGSLVCLLYAVGASGSRTALLSILLAAVLWAGGRGLLLLRARRLVGVAVLGSVALFLGLAVLAYRMTPPDVATPLGRLKDGIQKEGLFGHLYVTRFSGYPLIFRILEEYPLSGVGVGVYAAEVGKQQTLLLPGVKILEPYLLSSYAPNQFLNTGAELGLPAMIALGIVFVFAATRALSRRTRAGSPDLAISLLVLVVALQLGPAFYNSEALVFFWLLIGLSARVGTAPVVGAEPPARPWTLGRGATAGLVAGVLAVGVGGHLLSRSSLAVDSQWKRLRWRLNIGMHPPEPGGQWSQPEATFVVDSNAPEVIVRWHVGDEAAKDYRAEVSFFVDGALVEKSVAPSGRIRESALPLPASRGFKRISVRVSPPYVPAEAFGAADRRRLGIFIHSVTPVEATPAPPPARPPLG
jgi:O-antigen ligase